jgi:hemoglobin-like flavoprotein
MDQRQIMLVQQSFARAARIGPHVAATFYGELFAIDPSLRALFKTDMIAQGRKLMEMLAYVVDGLNDAEAMLPQVRELAVRHVAYGVEPHHYATVGTALLRTLRHELGADFTAETRAAWTAAYQLLSDVMREAAYGAAASRSI